MQLFRRENFDWAWQEKWKISKEIVKIMKKLKSLEESGLLIKDIRMAIKNEAKTQKDGYLGMLLGTLYANLLGSTLSR